MSGLSGIEERNWFLDGQIAQVLGEYFTRLERCEEARDEYQKALTAFEKIPQGNLYFEEARNNRTVILEKFSQLPNKQKSCEDFTLEKLFSSNVKSSVKLNKWFEGIFSLDWLPSAGATHNSAFDFRGLGATLNSASNFRGLGGPTRGNRTTAFSREKLFDLSDYEEGFSATVVLKIKITRTADETYAISLMLLPDQSQLLPLGLTLIVEDEKGDQAHKPLVVGESDSLIEIEFAGLRSDELFSVNLSLGKITVTEDFEV